MADMDFRTPDFIVEALKKRCEHEIFGYTFGSDEYYESIINGYTTNITGKYNGNGSAISRES